MLNIAIGKRNQTTTDVFVEGVRQATARGQFQLTSDGWQPYKSAVTTTLSDRVDFAQLIKVYRAPNKDEHRYSPAEVAAVATWNSPLTDSGNENGPIFSTV